MFRSKTTIALSILALLMTTSALAFADCQRKISLTITGAGNASDISGTAEVRSRDNRQRFKVSMDARVSEGTTYSVLVNGSIAGTVTIDALGSGELEIDNDKGRPLPAAVNPVCSISTVEVRDSNGVIVLFGQF